MRFEVDKNGCWNYTGTLDPAGYGKVILKGVTFRAPRLMAHITIKPLMSDMEIVAHRCDNPRCINPEHLFITTALGNMRDRDEKGRGAIGARHPNVKLTETDVRDMREKYGAGMSLSAIQRHFPTVTIGCVQAVCERRTWKHIH
jgi:hypothetical protein